MRATTRILAAAAALLVLAGCAAAPEAAGLPSLVPDPWGNLVVNNQSGTRLVLYNGETALKTIPDSASDFLVNVPNPSGTQVDLRLRRTDGSLFRRWVALLAPTAQESERLNWRVEALPQSPDSATLVFTYYGSGTGTSVNVDVVTASGARLAQLDPGRTRKVVVAAGNYRLNYQYWTSSQDSAGGRTDLGTVELVADSWGIPVPIQPVLTADQVLPLAVPAWPPAPAAPYGTLTVKNLSPDHLAVELWSQDLTLKIEQVADFGSSSPANQSTLVYSGQRTYRLRAGTYTFVARTLGTGAVVETSYEVTVTGGSAWDWTIDGVGENGR